MSRTTEAGVSGCREAPTPNVLGGGQTNVRGVDGVRNPDCGTTELGDPGELALLRRREGESGIRNMI